MDKTRQTELVRWLKQHSTSAKRWLRISMLLGVVSGLLIIAQAWFLAVILQALIMEHTPREQLLTPFILLLAVFVLRALLTVIRERVGFRCGQVVRQEVRNMVLNKLQALGPVWVKGKPAGSWATIVLEQIEDMQEYYSRYLPQMYLAGIIPIMILIAIFPFNWAAALILFATAPLIPIFMALVGLGAADANRRNFVALGRLSGSFLDRLRGLDTLRLFFREKAEVQQIRESTEDFRSRTMEVLRMAFLSSGVLEFFASISIAIVAVYFGFSYLGELNFGSYGLPVTMFAGFLALILSPEFFQPLRDLGTYYHAKAQAVGAAESLVTLLESDGEQKTETGDKTPQDKPIQIEANKLEIYSHDGQRLVGPLDFTIEPQQRIAVVGQSGAGKSSLLNLLLGFLPYKGSIKINGDELKELCPDKWRALIGWVGQNPHLPEQTLIENICLGKPTASEAEIQQAIDDAYVSEFLPMLPDGLNTRLGDYAARLSVGQAQRVAVARTLLKPSRILLLDEPAASLDAHSEKRVMHTLNQLAQQQTTIMVTHLLEETVNYDQIWVMANGQIIQRGHYAQLSQSEGPFARLLAHRSEEL
ncbi:TPA: cysteine/glutathione ABC transporter permease/ATP-binding protein CydD [Providencia stuartii]|uniref:Cysteine/glutathione ABC transporter permease/ATP-binding protein CydD n=2 Tax=Providencia stuartii TaxID=588 RepID=A0AAJ1JJ24_PROST|nr:MULTISPECIES: cysteine/glutathione ABC transporter permease/ATP-binding protein CydD [Providencia]SST02448.1 ABC transporter ATP-binding protein [Acinetobacter baumannii]AFH95119.1 cysteine/glutathione ABC transporter membrane/ATP-binding component [Providencia stuartii MRSN 2154]APG52965.1 cysteine/glutathione ABC transporter permease/ATP-binding protein CydD [Providencia stuartii]AVE42770.1 thiol reductant ABC exporter subunit CydD [Providencia stuartii]AVL40865.1 thiol reductant ABC expo